MEEELRKDCAVEVELSPGEGGVFKVMAGDRLLFSKKQAGRFPETEEIITLVRQL